MKFKPYFEYDKETCSSLCILNDGHNTFVGTATCHEDDKDMASEKTGYIIACKRAQIKYYQHLINNEIKPALKALNQVYHNMINSKRFNEKSYENKMLQRQIRFYKNDLEAIKETLRIEREELRKFINDKDIFYKKIRANRKAEN